MFRFVCFSVGVIYFIILSLSSQLLLANYLGADVQTFTPTADQAELLTVQTGRTLNKGWWSFSILTSYSKNNLLIYKIPIEDQIKQVGNDTLFSLHPDIAFGFNDHWQWGLSLPIYMDQKISNSLIRKLYIQNGVVSFRNSIKYSLSDKKDENGTAIIFNFDLPNVRNDPYVGKKVNPIFTLELAFDKKYEDGLVAFNTGYKVRSPSDPIPQATMWPLSDEFLYSMGWTQKFHQGSALSYNFELVGSTPVGETKYKRSSDISTLEGIIGIKGVANKFNTWTFGGGFELLKESMSPEWRMFIGYAWSWPNMKRKKRDIILDSEVNDETVSSSRVNSAWKEQLNSINADDFDKDGVSEENDECPDTPANVAVDKYGCPFDSDNDGVADFEDSCPSTPPNDVVDRKGCSVQY